MSGIIKSIEEELGKLPDIVKFGIYTSGRSFKDFCEALYEIDDLEVIRNLLRLGEEEIRNIRGYEEVGMHSISRVINIGELIIRSNDFYFTTQHGKVSLFLYAILAAWILSKDNETYRENIRKHIVRYLSLVEYHEFFRKIGDFYKNKLKEMLEDLGLVRRTGEGIRVNADVNNIILGVDDEIIKRRFKEVVEYLYKGEIELGYKEKIRELESRIKTLEGLLKLYEKDRATLAKCLRELGLEDVAELLEEGNLDEDNLKEAFSKYFSKGGKEYAKKVIIEVSSEIGLPKDKVDKILSHIDNDKFEEASEIFVKAIEDTYASKLKQGSPNLEEMLEPFKKKIVKELTDNIRGIVKEEIKKLQENPGGNYVTKEYLDSRIEEIRRDITQSLEEIQGKLDGVAGEVRELKTEMEQKYATKEALRGVQEGMTQIGDRLIRVEEGLGEVGDKVNGLQQGFEELRREVREIREGVGRLEPIVRNTDIPTPPAQPEERNEQENQIKVGYAILITCDKIEADLYIYERIKELNGEEAAREYAKKRPELAIFLDILDSR